MLVQGLDWARTSVMGCGHQLCSRFAATPSLRLSDVEIFVCQFNPAIYNFRANRPGDIGPCLGGVCPQNAQNCVEFESVALEKFDTGLYYCGIVYYNVVCIIMILAFRFCKDAFGSARY